jgi:hypothetical protein
MATGDKADLLNTISTNIIDNDARLNTPAKVRTVDSAIVTYNLNQKELTRQEVDGAVGFLAGHESKDIRLTPQVVDPAYLEGLTWYDNVNKGIAFYNNLGKQLSRTRLNFFVASITTVAVPNSPNAATFFPGLVGVGENTGFTVHPTTGSVRNASGRDLAKVTGVISIQPVKSGGNVSLLSFFSEKSVDGVTWVKNSFSARTYDISNTGDSFKTSASFTTEWPNNSYLRFRFFADDSTLSFVSPTVIADGDTIRGYSMAWELEEM